MGGGEGLDAFFAYFQSKSRVFCTKIINQTVGESKIKVSEKCILFKIHNILVEVLLTTENEKRSLYIIPIVRLKSPRYSRNARWRR
jgi:hypothetical protein